MYDRAVVRWLGRFCLERPFATFYDLQRAIDAFDRLPSDPEQSERVLRNLVSSILTFRGRADTPTIARLPGSGLRPCGTNRGWRGLPMGGRVESLPATVLA
jgi:hypothetical protein